jgi:hypothetical protein
MDALKAIIPIIPGLITAGKSVWNEIIKPLLKGKGYNCSSEQDQEMNTLEEKKDIKTFIEKLERIDQELNRLVIMQNQTGDNSTQVGVNTGVIDYSTTINVGVEEKTNSVKKNLEILDEDRTIDVTPLLKNKKHDKFCLINVLFDIPGLKEFTMAEIYNEYKKSRICKNHIIKPYVFTENFMRGHTPIIVYEAGDYVSNFNNWSIYDKLQIQNHYLKYSFCEMSDFNTILINGSLLLGSIYSLLIMVNRVLKTLDKECKLLLKLTIIANERMIFRMQQELMNIDSMFLETYYLGKNQKHEISFYFNTIDNNEINKFTNRFLGLFVSENQKSTKPFLSVTIDETRGFYDFLLQHDRYLMIGN